MNKDHVFAFLKNCILDLTDLDAEGIQSGSSLDELGLDSLDFVEVQVLIKRTFGVQVNQAAIASGEIKTLADFSSHVVACHLTGVV